MASVRRLLLAANFDEECDALRHLVKVQESTTEHHFDIGLLNCEPPVLLHDGDDEGHNSSQSLLEDLLLYLIVREFKVTVDSAGIKPILGIDQQTLANWERREVQQHTELENHVETLHGFLLKSEWNSATVSTLSRVVKRLQDPRARQHFLAFAFQILRLSSQPKETLHVLKVESEDKFFDEAVRLLLLGVTDLWSAIRKDCAKTAAAIAFEFSSQCHIEQFMDSLLCVAIGSRSVSADKSQVTAWTEREGALLALSTLLHSVKMESTDHQLEDNKETKISQVKDDIKGLLGARQFPVTRYHLGSNGRHTLTQLPRCLIQTLKPAIYHCLRHDQISIRQLAAQCLVEYVSLCEEPTRLLTFQEVISKLNRMNRNDNVGENDTAENPNESELLDAFEAEGLLDVLARMVPCLPSSFLFKHWKFVFPTLEKYVIHIASSVRQRSSSVVLALAKKSTSSINHGPDELVSNPATGFDEAALKLMVQMLLSLSKQREDGSSFCWQQKEGRLLSIDVLINVLGESLSDSCKLLRWKPELTKVRERRPGSFSDLQSILWAHDRISVATWVFNPDEGGQHAQETGEGGKNENKSLADVISAWIEKNGVQIDLPSSSHGFWQHVLSGCITQTKEAFESSQFELRRISRQILPSLMRLVIWTDQLKIFSSTQLENASSETPWCWTCMKYILLHLRYLEESKALLGERSESPTSQKLTADWKIVWNGILALESNEQHVSVDTEATAAKVEVKAMAFLSFGASADPPRQITWLIDGALRSIHKNLPEEMKLRTLLATTGPNDSSLDRQICVFLVPIMPAIVATLQYLIEQHGSIGVRSREADLSWSSRWLCLERMALVWLWCDDMFRWITLNKSEAQSQLLESLRVLLHFSKTGLSQTEEVEEADKIVQCLNDTFGAPQAKGVRVKDAIYMPLLDIYLQIWLRSIKSDSRVTNKVLVAITHLYCQRQQYDANAKPADSGSTCPAVVSWAEWDDEDEIQLATPVEDMQEPHRSPTCDSMFQEVLKSLDSNQLSQFCVAVRGLFDLPSARDIPVQHISRMQQQIETTLGSS